MLDFIFKTSHAIRLSVNLAVIMMAMHILSGAFSIDQGQLKGMPQVLAIIVYMVYLVHQSMVKSEKLRQGNEEGLQNELDARIAEVAEYDKALGEMMANQDATIAREKGLQERIAKYEDSILADRKTIADMQKKMDERNAQLSDALSVAERWKAHSESLSQKVKEKQAVIDAYIRQEEERRAMHSERARKAAQSRQQKAQDEDEEAHEEEPEAIAA